MSLIIGIRCQDGIVVAAESAATFGSMGRSTITQSAKKIKLPADGVICAIAGSAGLSQQFTGCIRKLWEDPNFRKLGRHDIMSNIGVQFFQYSKPLLEAAKTAKDLFGQVAWESAAGQAIVAMGLSDGPALFWFDEACSPEEVTDDLPFVTIGSGRIIADPFLALIKRVIWRDTTPLLSVGIFSAVWTLEHAIATNAGGLAGPIQLITLTITGTTTKIATIDQDLLKVYRSHVALAEERVASVRDILNPENTSADQGISAIPIPDSGELGKN